MATAGWRENGDLKTLVFRHYGRFNVFQLMRLLLWKRAGVDRKHAPAIDRRLRFRADLSAAFPGREIADLRLQAEQAAQDETHAAGDGVVEIVTPNFCIASTLGPLPEPFTEWVRDLARGREPAMADFLNIFNQRINVLRFQLKARQTLALNNALPADTAHARYLAAVMGMAHPKLAAQIPLPPRAWLGLAGLLGNARRSAFAVARVLSDYTGVRVEVEELVGAWQAIEPEDRLALGRRNHRLGRRTVLGRAVRDPQARIRLHIAALAFDDFCRLLPPNAAERRLPPQTEADDAPAAYTGFVALIRLLLDRQCDCEVLLATGSAGIPPRRLSTAPDAGRHQGLRLGQTAWLDSGLGGAPSRRIRQAGYLVRAFDTREAA